ncbi:TRAP transporter small permease [Flavimaricola marinus]|uniref:TRAP transporter small permease protein n=1 Tax=Flavimaricola marinus TaxID=1819565 RepID=A0A238LIU9_9RHOB|nr:TRAP transporter small permease subunit [Flavimaricola marinus]SMY09325.1 Tripartite ATP-independent periplasmic transporters, DctQ component [Flavimaricola marinus]
MLARSLMVLSSRLNAVALWGAVGAVGVMVFSIMWQVVARYVFASPPIWTEELARYAMVWAGMLGASCAFYEHSDPNLFPGARSITGRRGLEFAVLRGIGVLIFAAPVIWFSFIGPNGGFTRGFISRSIARTAEMTGVPMIWFAIAIPTAFVLILIHSIADIAGRAAATDQEKDG